jgi:hypothetical protein
MAQRPLGDTTWVEPDSQAEFSKYPYNHVQQTESGHSLEFDDTPNYERIRLQHRIGNYTEIQSNGDEVHKIKGDNYEIIVKNNHVLIKGYCTVTIQGDSVLNVKGDVYQKIEGDVNQKIEGDMTTVVSGDANITSESDVNISAGSLTGQINLNSPFNVTINSDLHVGGSITSTGSIYSAENVMAGQKLYSQLGISTLGGLNVGAVDNPGPMIPGVINAGVAVNVPTVNALTLNDVIGPVIFMRAIFTTHTHPAPNGVTGVPFRGQL